MEEFEARAKASLPSVILTLLSIIQALALSELWEHSLTQFELLNATQEGAVLALQLGATLLVILLIWLMYVESVMRLTWTPDMMDLVAPFFVGILELCVILNTGLRSIDNWFYFLAVLAVGMYALEHRMAVRARADSENEHFFSKVGKATWIDHAMPLSFAVLLAFSGAWYSFTGRADWVVLVATSLTIVVSLYTIKTLHRFWKLSLG